MGPPDDERQAIGPRGPIPGPAHDQAESGTLDLEAPGYLSDRSDLRGPRECGEVCCTAAIQRHAGTSCEHLPQNRERGQVVAAELVRIDGHAVRVDTQRMGSRDQAFESSAP